MLGFLFSAAAVVWIGTFIYVVVLVQRQRRLRLELEDVRRMLEDIKEQ